MKNKTEYVLDEDAFRDPLSQGSRHRGQNFYPSHRPTQNSSKGSIHEATGPSRLGQGNTSIITPLLRRQPLENSYEHYASQQPKGYQLKTSKLPTNLVAKGAAPYAVHMGRTKKGSLFTAKKSSLKGTSTHLLYDPAVVRNLADQPLEVGVSIDRINHWYNDKKQSLSPEELAASIEYRKMLQHYN